MWMLPLIHEEIARFASTRSDRRGTTNTSLWTRPVVILRRMHCFNGMVYTPESSFFPFAILQFSAIARANSWTNAGCRKYSQRPEGLRAVNLKHCPAAKLLIE